MADHDSRVVPLAQEGFRVDCPRHGVTFVAPASDHCPKCHEEYPFKEIGFRITAEKVEYYEK